MFHVYQIVEKESGNPVYIGCTTNPRKRASDHRSNGVMTAACNFIVALVTQDKRLALDAERNLIQISKSKGCTVSNKFPAIVFRIGKRLFTRKQLMSHLACCSGTVSNYLREGGNSKVTMYSHKTWKPVTVERIKQ